MYIVTGGAGFIGSNFVHEMNAHGITDILVVDNLTDSRKLLNLHGACFADYMHKLSSAGCCARTHCVRQR